MTPDLEALARAIVASPRWRWMPGMHLIDQRGWCWWIVNAHTSGAVQLVLEDSRHNESNDWGGPCIKDSVPDLTAPATLGCLLALVREAWKRPMIVVVPGLSPDPASHRWYVQDNPPNTASGHEPTLRADGTFSALSASAEVSAPTEVAALVAALLAAP